MKRLFAVFRFLMAFALQVIISSLEMMWLVLRPRVAFRSRVIEVPVSIRSDAGMFVFATAISMTPGSLTIGADFRRRTLKVHLLDTRDDVDHRAALKEALEVPLEGVFR